MVHATTQPGVEPLGDLHERIAVALGMLRDCELCEWRCHVDRLTQRATPCRLGGQTRCFKRYVSLAEELELVPCVRVYLGGCNFRCRFCNVAPDCFDPGLGELIQPEHLADELTRAVGDGAQTISFLGGEPSLHPHTILQIAAAAKTELPLVLDTNMYMTPQVLELLQGVVKLYLADFKFGSDACARRLAGVSRYMEVLTRNLRTAAATTPLLVRHLLMPGHLECCFIPVADWVARNLPGTRFQLRTGYVPCYRAGSDGVIGRLNTAAEVRAARAHLESLDSSLRIEML